MEWTLTQSKSKRVKDTGKIVGPTMWLKQLNNADWKLKITSKSKRLYHQTQ